MFDFAQLFGLELLSCHVKLLLLQQRPVNIVMAILGVILLNCMHLLIHETVIVEVFHVLVEFEYHRQRIWDLVPLDLLVAKALQDFEDAAEGVLVADDDYTLVVHHLRANDVVPERHDAINCALE